jgi:hypothetical protein
MRWALWLWLAFGVVLAVRILLQPDSHVVFPVFAGGSAHWWNDAPLYQNHAPLDYFRYAPAFAIAFTPFAWLGSSVGGVLWGWLSLGVYFHGLTCFRRDVLPGSWTEKRHALFLVLALAGGLAGLWNGQSNALLTGLVLLGVSAFARQRWWPAAFFFALPALWKLTPLPVILLFCALRPRQLTARIGILLALGLFLPFLTRPPSVVWEQYQGWAHQLADLSSQRWPGFRDGWTMWVVLHHMGIGEAGIPDLEEPLQAPWYRALQVVSGLLVLAGCLFMKHRRQPAGEVLTLTYALGAGWLMLLGPAVEYPTYVFLAPALAWAAVQRDHWPGSRLIEAATVLILLFGWSELSRPFWAAFPPLLLALPLGSLCFLAWSSVAVLHLSRPRRLHRRRAEPLRADNIERTPAGI